MLRKLALTRSGYPRLRSAHHEAPFGGRDRRSSCVTPLAPASAGSASAADAVRAWARCPARDRRASSRARTGSFSDNKNPKIKIKILGNGELTKKFTVKVPCSASAKAKIEKAGGSVA